MVAGRRAGLGLLLVLPGLGAVPVLLLRPALRPGSWGPLLADGGVLVLGRVRPLAVLSALRLRRLGAGLGLALGGLGLGGLALPKLLLRPPRGLLRRALSGGGAAGASVRCREGLRPGAEGRGGGRTTGTRSPTLPLAGGGVAAPSSFSGAGRTPAFWRALRTGRNLSEPGAQACRLAHQATICAAVKPPTTAPAGSLNRHPARGSSLAPPAAGLTFRLTVRPPPELLTEMTSFSFSGTHALSFSPASGDRPAPAKARSRPWPAGGAGGSAGAAPGSAPNRCRSDPSEEVELSVLEPDRRCVWPFCACGG